MEKRELSQLLKKLPKVPGILGRKEYLNSSIMVLLIYIEGNFHFVFQKRNKTIRQGGEICFPGGKLDDFKDKDSRETAIRETCEELGISKKKLKIIGQLDTLFSMSGALIEAYIGTIDVSNIGELNPDPAEVEKVFTVPVDFFLNNEPEKHSVMMYVDPNEISENGELLKIFNAKELGLPEIYDKPWGKKKYDVLIYRYQNEIIWGITARFVYEFISKLRECK